MNQETPGMPRGQYKRKQVPIHRFSITFHEKDFPHVRSAAKRAKQSIASFVRDCVFSTIGRPERERMTDQESGS